MTDPGQVSVNVADLRRLEWALSTSWIHLPEAARVLVAAIPEPEWEPTDDMRAKYRRADEWEDLSDDYVDRHLKALHREGLL